MSNLIIDDICKTSLIYNTADNFEYSLPKNILESFLSGRAFDHLQPYSEDESAKLKEDINSIYRNIMAENPTVEKIAIITAGAPGAGKTTLLNQDKEKSKALGKSYAYICPDDVCLKNQIQTYQADIKAGNNSKESLQASYNKWRPGSNAATHLIVANLIRQNYGFYFGTTSSSPATEIFFNFLKEKGYHIKLLHVTSPDNIRVESVKQRDKTFVQTTEKDITEKGLLLPQRIQDTFLKHADEIEFYYRYDVNTDALLAAKWIRNPSELVNRLQIIEESSYQNIKTIHNKGVVALNKLDLLWENTVEKH